MNDDFSKIKKDDIVEGKVHKITPFGAFVTLDDGRKGLVHISQIADAFVKDINHHLRIGEVVRVKVMALSNDGKIDLSIKKAAPKEAQHQKPRPPNKRSGFRINPFEDQLNNIKIKKK